MPAPTMRADFDGLYEDRHPYLKKAMFLEFEQHPEEYSAVLNMKTSDRMKETDFMVAELGQFSVKNEGAPIATDGIQPSYSKDFLHVTYAKGVEVTMEAIDDDQDGIMADQARALGYSAHETIETIAANEVFNNAFTTTTSADLATIYGTHTTALGFSIANFANVDLDLAGIQTALTHFGTLLSEAGNHIRMMPVHLIVPQALEWVARELIESAGRPDTSRNAKNVFQSSLRVVVNHYITDPTAWFVWAAPSIIKAKWFWRRRPTPVKDSRYTNLSGLTGMWFRQSVGVSDWRGLWGARPSAA